MDLLQSLQPFSSLLTQSHLPIFPFSSHISSCCTKGCSKRDSAYTQLPWLIGHYAARHTCLILYAYRMPCLKKPKPGQRSNMFYSKCVQSSLCHLNMHAQKQGQTSYKQQPWIASTGHRLSLYCPAALITDHLLSRQRIINTPILNIPAVRSSFGQELPLGFSWNAFWQLLISKAVHAEALRQLKNLNKKPLCL